MTKLARLNARIEQLRQELFTNVQAEDLDIDTSYALMRELREVSNKRDAEALRHLEVGAALDTLKRHGVVFKVWGEEELRQRVEQLPGMTLGNIDKIVDHGLEGDDWATMGEVTAEEDANIWAIIKGTAGDHPEWFSHEAREKL